LSILIAEDNLVNTVNFIYPGPPTWERVVDVASYKWIKIRPEDHEILSRYMLYIQLRKRKRLGFPALIHHIIEEYVKPELEKLERQFGAAVNEE